MLQIKHIYKQTLRNIHLNKTVIKPKSPTSAGFTFQIHLETFPDLLRTIYKRFSTVYLKHKVCYHLVSGSRNC